MNPITNCGLKELLIKQTPVEFCYIDSVERVMKVYGIIRSLDPCSVTFEKDHNKLVEVNIRDIRSYKELKGDNKSKVLRKLKRIQAPTFGSQPDLLRKLIPPLTLDEAKTMVARMESKKSASVAKKDDSYTKEDLKTGSLTVPSEIDDGPT